MMLWEESVFFRHREDDSKNFRKILKVFRLEGCPEWEKAAAAFLPPGVQAGHCRGKRRRLTLVTGLNEAVRRFGVQFGWYHGLFPSHSRTGGELYFLRPLYSLSDQFYLQNRS